MSWTVLANNPKPNALSGLARGLSASLPGVVEHFVEKKKQSTAKEIAEKEMVKEDATLEALYPGIKIRGVRNPETRKAIVSGLIKADIKKGDFENIKNLIKDRAEQPDNNSLNDEAVEQPSEQPIQSLAKPSLASRGAQVMPERGNPASQQPAQAKAPSKPKLSTEQLLGVGAINQNAANLLQRQETNAQKQEIADKKAEQNAAKHKADQEQKEREFFHKETKKYDEKLEADAEASEERNRALDRQMKDVDKIGWFDRAVSAVFGQSKFGDLLRSKTAQEFDSNVLPQMAGLRQLLGGVLSDSDIRLLLQKVVTASKDPEANKAIANWMRNEGKYKIAMRDIAAEIKRENGGYRTKNYQADIRERFKERYGTEINRDFEAIKNLKGDPEKERLIIRRPVPPGTPLSPQSMDLYLDMYNQDADEALAAMIEDGYDTGK